jgi:hypothetical protein
MKLATEATSKKMTFFIVTAVENLNRTKNSAFRKLDLIPSSGEGMEISTLLGPLERANHNH